MNKLISFVLLLLMAPSSNDHHQAEAFAANDANKGDVPQLPPPDPDSNLPSIRLGETIRLEEIGPIILNTDGTTRRIDNWDTLTAREKEVTWRRISKRNEERRQMLLKQQEEMLKQQEEENSEDVGEL